MRQSPFDFNDRVINLEYGSIQAAKLKDLRKKKLGAITVIVVATTCFAFGVISMVLADRYLGIFLGALVCVMNLYYAQHYVKRLRVINAEIVSANSIWI